MGIRKALLPLAFPVAGCLAALDGAPPASEAPLGPQARYLEAELLEILQLLRAAEAAHAALLAAGPAPDGWDRSARAEGDQFMALAILWARQADAALAEADLYDAQRHVLGRGVRTGSRRLFIQAACRRCWERREGAVGGAILAAQAAVALAAQGGVRLAMAEAMARCQDLGASLDAQRLRAAVDACAGVVAAVAEADATVGVHLEFLEAQEADFNRVLASLDGWIQAFRRQAGPPA